MTVVVDSSPNVKHLWNAWEAKRARIEDGVLVVEFSHGTLKVEAADPELVADLLFAHDSKGEIVTGKLGINKVDYEEKLESSALDDAAIEIAKALKLLMSKG